MKCFGMDDVRHPRAGAFRVAAMLQAPCPGIPMCIFLEFFMNWWYIYRAKSQGISCGYFKGISCRTASGRTSV